MGCCTSTDGVEGEEFPSAPTAFSPSSSLEVPKWLLLGPSRGGKSTIFKQVKILFGGGLSDKELMQYKDSIYNHIIEQMKLLVLQYDVLRKKKKKSPHEVSIDLTLTSKGEQAIAIVRQLRGDIDIDEDIATHILRAWKEKPIKQIFHNRYRYKDVIQDSSSYFFNDISRISHRHYIPTDKDVLYVQSPTVGAMKKMFEIERTVIQLCDLGGSANEQINWKRYYENVNTVVFVVSLSSYDELTENNLNIDVEAVIDNKKQHSSSNSADTALSSLLTSDFSMRSLDDKKPGVNAMHYAMLLFKAIVNHRWFVDANFCLILNKQDIFVNKIMKVPLTVCFNEYNGSDDVNQCIAYIKSRFEALVDESEEIGAIPEDEAVPVPANVVPKRSSLAEGFSEEEGLESFTVPVQQKPQREVHTFVCNALDRDLVEKIFMHLFMQQG